MGHRDVVAGMMWVNEGVSVITGGKDGRLILHHIEQVKS